MYKIVLEFGNGNRIEGVNNLTYEECKKRIDNYLSENTEIAKKENFKFSIEKC